MRHLRSHSRNVLVTSGLVLAILLPAAAAAERSSGADAWERGSSRISHVIELESSRGELRVVAELEERLSSSFVLDTGATVNVIPRAIVEALGISIREDAPRIEVTGLLPEPRQVPVITLERVRVGSLVVRDVQMAVVDDSPAALLGMPFFGRFRVQIDSVAGTLTLDEVEATAAPAPTPQGPDQVLHVAKVELSWIAVAGAVSYRVEVAADADFERILGSARADEPRLELGALGADFESSSVYFWRVRAADDHGSSSPWSQTSGFRLP